MLWEHTRGVKCSKISQFFDDNIFTYLGPLFGAPWVSKPLSWGSKNAKKHVFSTFRSQNRDKNIFMGCFEENKKGINFSDTYLGPYLGPGTHRIMKMCDFLHNFVQENGFSYQNSDSGGPK